MAPSTILGIIFALTSAFVWGSGDFSGGLASRRSDHFQALILAAPSGLVVVALLSVVRGEWPLSPEGLGWSVAAGASGAVGMAALYRGLAVGSAAFVAPIAAVIGALLPVLFGAWLEGMPALAQLAGFLVGTGGISLVIRASAGEKASTRQDVWLATAAGLGFGGFFVLIGQVDRGSIFSPLVVVKAITTALAMTMLLVRGQRVPGPASNPTALLAGILDAGGSVFYMLARRFTRLDVAAVLSSMYPVSTVMLASLILRESVTRAQWLGVALCVLAVALIAM